MSKRMRIVRLFTVGTPHQGATLAEIPTMHPLQMAMREDSRLLRALATAYATADYALIPFVRLDDSVIGSEHAAPDGDIPWWVHTPAGETAHVGSALDARIQAEIAARLRGEPATATEPRAPFSDAGESSG